VWRVAVFVGVLVAAGCGGRRHEPDADAGSDGAVGRDAATGRDASTETDGSPVGDDAGAPICDCAERVPVGLFHACTPPLEAGCPILVCTPGAGDCGPGDTCEQCAAAACCECAACVPACVHTAASPGDALPPLLKLGTVWGPGGEEPEIAVEGAPFYVGALGYSIRVGESGDLPQLGGAEPCGLTALAPAEPAGTMLPVWVSQYGFSEPWVLAGFFSWIANDDYPTCVQPGFSCAADAACCETADVPMACRSGQCRRE
jgi:hypothetical protein